MRHMTRARGPAMVTRREKGEQPLMHRLETMAVVALLALLAPLAAPGAEIYRWVDDEGGVHYSQQPPGDREAERVKGARAPAEDPARRQQEIEALMESNKYSVYKQRLEREDAAVERRQREYLTQYCRTLRDKRRILATQPQVREQTDEGYRMMSAEDRQQRLTEFDERIESRCSGIPSTN